MKNKLAPEVRFPGFTGDWEQRRLNQLVTSVVREVPKPDKPYKRISVRSHAKGTFHQKVDDPKTVAMDKLYVVKENDLMVNITFAWEHAIAVACKEDDGLLVSHRFPTYVIDKSDINFIRYTVSQEKFRRKMELISPGGAGRNRVLNKKDFVNLKIDVPIQMEEQTQIGNFFIQLDNVISHCQRELTTLKQTKQGFLQKVFPKEGESVPEIRFPGFTGEWEQHKVIDFSEKTFGGGTPKTSIKEYWNGEIPWIQSSDLHEHQVSNVVVKKKITEKGLKNSATKLIPKNSIAIVTRVGVGKIALMQFEYTTSQDFLSLSNLKVNEWFGVYSLYNLLQKELNNVQGTSIKGITKKELLDKKIYAPTDLEEQTKIGNFFRQLDKTIALHQCELDALKETKKAFLQKMFV